MGDRNVSKVEDVNKINTPEIEDEKKRKREAMSSVSSQSDVECKTLDKNIEKSISKKKLKAKARQLRKKMRQCDKISEEGEEVDESGDDSSDVEDDQSTNNTILEEIRGINKKLENVVTKDDESIKKLISSLITKTKEEILRSVEKKFEILESKFFEKQVENDALRKSVEKMNGQLNSAEDENRRLKREIERQSERTIERINNLEQYGRRNNIRMEGIADKERETAMETSQMIVREINSKIKGINLTVKDIDIAHRLGKYNPNKQRAIIIKFNSRMAKQEIMVNRRSFYASKIFINEDLTKLNMEALQSVRLKQKDIVASAWSREGKIFYKDVNEQIHEVTYNRFQYWLDLAWPVRK